MEGCVWNCLALRSGWKYINIHRPCNANTTNVTRIIWNTRYSSICNINGRDVQRKNVVKCGQVKFMGTMTKWPVQKHTEHHKTRSIQRPNRHKEITIFWVFDFSDFYFQLLKGLLQKMLNYRLGTVNVNCIVQMSSRKLL